MEIKLYFNFKKVRIIHHKFLLYFFLSFSISSSLLSFLPFLKKFHYFLCNRSPALTQENIMWKRCLKHLLWAHSSVLWLLSKMVIISWLWQYLENTSESSFHPRLVLKELDLFSDARLSEKSILVTYNSMIPSPSTFHILSKIVRENQQE